MKKNARVWILAWVLLPASLPGTLSVRADDSAANPTAAPITDPTLVAQHYRQVLARPPFQENNPPAVDTRIEEWLSQWFNRLGKQLGNFTYAGGMPAFESLLMTLLVVASLAALIYVMVRLTRRRGRMEATPDETVPGRKTFQPPEFYDGEIHEAIRVRDWHAAWLAAWRQFLSRLENRRLVEADRTRTNREYLAQLRAQTLPSSSLALLTGLVDAYDRFIYGRHAIGESEWNLFHQQIEKAGLLLHLEDRGTAAAAAIKTGSP